VSGEWSVRADTTHHSTTHLLGWAKRKHRKPLVVYIVISNWRY